MAIDILIVDDEPDIRDLIAGILEDEGFETRTAHDADSALAELAKRRPSLVFMDIWMHGSRLDGLQLLDEFQNQSSELPVVMISGHGNVETAVSAIQRGAFDYIEKPFKIDRLLLIAQRALERSQLQSKVEELKQKSGVVADALVGSSPDMVLTRSLIEKTGPTNSRIFIAGPSGTGKSLCAKLIHDASTRADGPFVEFNATYYSDEETADALFGNEYSDADGTLRSVPGALERAHGGTLYLSEVTALPSVVQSQFLRALVKNDFTRIGGQQTVPVDVRIVSSSSHDLQNRVENGEFRSDLFHRLAVVPFRLTPLAVRREDLPDLVDVFVEQVCRMHSLRRLKLGGDAIAVLQGQEWPGNARQLKNAIERVLILTRDNPPVDGMITASMLPSDIGEVLPTVGDGDEAEHLMSMPLKEAREVFERQYLQAQIERYGGNISKTAQFVGMERSALHRKIKSLGL